MPAAPNSIPFSKPALRVVPNRERELWLGKPKADKTLGKSDADFLRAAGFEAADKAPRIDDYRLVDGADFKRIGVRAYEMKAGDLVENVADGFFDAAIIGKDVLREFNQAVRGEKGRMNVAPIVDLDMAPCALAIAVEEKDPAKTIQDLNGRIIVTKYPASVANWAKKNKIELKRIIKRNGGIESYGVLMPGAVIADMVESGASLAANDWRLLGMNDSDWHAIRSGTRKFSDFSMQEMAAIPGVITPSRAMLVRPSRRLAGDKEAALSLLTERFMQASRALGNNPKKIQRNVAVQRDFKPAIAAREQRGDLGNMSPLKKPTWV